MSVLRTTLGVAACLGIVGYGAFKIVQYRSDGPLNDIIPGGPLRAGELVSQADVNWVSVLGQTGQCDGQDCPRDPIELQFEQPALSRYTGIMVHDGELYVPCDLGYMWGRFDGERRHILHLIYLFKDWHENALEDGRAVLRIDGKRYPRQAVRVTDPALIADLKVQLEDMARVWVAPEPLAEAPAEEPNDIWFFRMDPRGEV